jgi:hypothetical protein
MGPKSTAAILVLLVFICPYSCIGSTLIPECTDPCCPPKSTAPADMPQAPDENCTGSCGGCLCGGAISDDEIRPDLDVAQSLHGWLATIPMRTTDAGLSLSDSDPTHSRLILPGAALRALFQSFLL